MAESIPRLHQRYTLQTKWTRELRTYVLGQLDLKPTDRVLEIGSGTGAVLADWPAQIPRVTPPLFGIDIDLTALRAARANLPAIFFMAGTARKLPFPAGTFRICYCHYALLWIQQPAQALQEMRRVTRKGGSVIAFAEPDYSARTDAPAEFMAAGVLQSQALRIRGANTAIGSQLVELFNRCGLHVREAGLLQNTTAIDRETSESEWHTMEQDIRPMMPTAELESLRQLDKEARLSNTRHTLVPTHYVWAQV